jgi:uncharacterized protein
LNYEAGIRISSEWGKYMTQVGVEPYGFKWQDLGDIEAGRPNLGLTSSALIYRLMESTLKEVLIRQLGREQADWVLKEAGRLAGSEFCAHLLDTKLAFPEFIAQLQARLKEFGIGILRVEKADLERLDFIITVSEDLDCSGLPVTGEMVCVYDEGFIDGILRSYTGRDFDVREIDCWASGGRICRFVASAK